MFAKVRKLGDVVDIIGGGTPSKANEGFYEGDILWATVRDMKQEHLTDTELKITHEAIMNSSTNIIKAGNIIIATRVGLGKVCKLQKDTAINQDLKALIPKNSDLDRDYLFWWLKSVANLIVEAGTGATVQGVKIPFIKALDIPLPSTAEQKRIVAILDYVFADIEKVRANAETNLKKARELLNSYLQKVFSQRGEGWREERVENLTYLVTKGSSPKWQGICYVDEPGILFVTSENVGRNEMTFKNEKYVEELFNQKASKSILQKGDVLTNIVGASIGRTAIYDRDNLANINQAVCLLRCKPDLLNNEYLAYLLNSPYFINFLHENEVNNARANLSLSFFRELAIPVPKLNVQHNIVKEIKAMLSKVMHLEMIYLDKLNAIDELKQSLLQKAFTGELTKSKGIAA